MPQKVPQAGYSLEEPCNLQKYHQSPDSESVGSAPDPLTSHLPTSQYAPCITTPGTSTTPSPIQQQCPNTISPVHPGPEPKPHLTPFLKGGVGRGKYIYPEVLVPEVLSESTPESKNRVLSEGIYGFFAQKYGTRNPRISKQQKKRERHERALKKVKQLKKEQGLPIESIQMFAHTFIKLVCEHSYLKQASQSAKQRSQASKTRQYCHRHFWQFAKQLLDDKSTSQVPPSLRIKCSDIC